MFWFKSLLMKGEFPLEGDGSEGGDLHLLHHNCEGGAGRNEQVCQQ